MNKLKWKRAEMMQVGNEIEKSFKINSGNVRPFPN